MKFHNSNLKGGFAVGDFCRINTFYRPVEINILPQNYLTIDDEGSGAKINGYTKRDVILCEIIKSSEFFYSKGKKFWVYWKYLTNLKQ